MDKDTIRQDFDKLAGVEQEKWNHNSHYHGFLAQYIPDNCRHALDIGCGTGEFTRIVAEKSKHVAGLDLSSGMLESARKRSESYPHITYLNADIMELPLEERSLDFIASLAVFHHLDLDLLLPKLKKALRPGGALAILDLYEQSRWEQLANLWVVPYNQLYLWRKKAWQTEAEKLAWQEHGANDVYMTSHELKKLYDVHLPSHQFKLHLFWRYSVVWVKE